MTQLVALRDEQLVALRGEPPSARTLTALGLLVVDGREEQQSK